MSFEISSIRIRNQVGIFFERRLNDNDRMKMQQIRQEGVYDDTRKAIEAKSNEYLLTELVSRRIFIGTES